MVNPERFRTRAEECDAKAETAPDPDLRLLYRDWRRSGAMAQAGPTAQQLDIDMQRLTRQLRAEIACYNIPAHG